MDAFTGWGGDMLADAPPRRPRPKQPFLKRGEGLQRRMDAYKQRVPRAITSHVSTSADAASAAMQPSYCSDAAGGTIERSAMSPKHAPGAWKTSRASLSPSSAAHWEAQQAEEVRYWA
jgi:hypothetical protein